MMPFEASGPTPPGGAPATTMDATLDEGLRRDLRTWVRGYYAARARLAAAHAGEAVERVFDAERKVLVGLSGVLMLGIASIPWLGPAGVLSGLAILYVGTMVSAVITLHRVRALRASVPTGASDAEVERAVAACPPLDAPGRAVLVRLINLSTTHPTPRSRELLRAALTEAFARPDLGGWGFLRDVSALYTGPEAERVGPLVEAAPTTEAAGTRPSGFGLLRRPGTRPR